MVAAPCPVRRDFGLAPHRKWAGPTTPLRRRRPPDERRPADGHRRSASRTSFDRIDATLQWHDARNARGRYALRKRDGPLKSLQVSGPGHTRPARI